MVHNSLEGSTWLTSPTSKTKGKNECNKNLKIPFLNLKLGITHVNNNVPYIIV